jgi:tripartite-type tricarboxylate transporter receptor subunit TctC
VTVALAQGGAAGFPDHPIRIIVSVPAGGGVDTITRIVTAPMRDPLGQPLIVENKAGVGGSVAAEVVFNSAPDGYTLLASQPSPITTNPFLYKSLNYDPTQLTPVAIMSHVPNVLLVRKDFPANTVQEFIAYAKANPGKLNYASQGIGTTSHLTAELFQMMAHVKLQIVPYRGSGPAMNDLVAGSVDCAFDNIGAPMQLVKAGKLKLIAVASPQRVPSLPDVPTIAETLPGFAAVTWFALVAPAQTPAATVDKINAGVNEALHDPDVQKRFADLSAAAAGGTPQATATYFRDETERWKTVITSAHVTLD